MKKGTSGERDVDKQTVREHRNMFVVALVVLVALISGCRRGGADSPGGAAIQGIESKYVMRAEQLYDDYMRNEVAADMKYGEQVVLIRGYVQQIAEDIIGDPYVVLSDGSIFGVQCYFNDRDRAELATLEKGMEAVIKCRVDKKIMNVQANSSILIAKGW